MRGRGAGEAEMGVGAWACQLLHCLSLLSICAAGLRLLGTVTDEPDRKMC